MSRKVDLEKLRSIRVGGRTRGQSRVRPLVDDTGRTSGFEVDHGDRQSAVVRPQPIRATTSLSTGETHAESR